MVEIEMSEILEESVNYDLVTMASLIESSRLYNKMEIEQMSFESRWLLESMDCGFILPITEASTTGKDVMKSIRNWIETMIAKIKADSVKRDEKYIPWIKANSEALTKAAASRTDGIKMTPYYNGKCGQDPQTVTSMISKGIQNLESGKYDDYSWSNPITAADNVKTSDKNLTNYIKNYFRFGLKDTLEIKSATLTPSDLSKRVPEFIEYLTSYGKTTPNNVDRIAKAYDTKRIEKILATTESLNSNMYLTVENCLLCETELSNLLNYSSIITEADEPKKEDAPEQTKIDNDTGASPTKVESESDNKPGEENKPEDKKDNKNNETNPNKASYAKAIEYFFKIIVTQYAAACDERFLVYLNVLKEIAKTGNIPLPKFDDNGRYIEPSSKEETKEENK